MGTDVSDILKHHGMRSTAIRKDVLNVLSDEGRALSHSDVESALAKVDRVTLYRTLDSFEDKGIIHQVHSDDGIRRYALCAGSCSEDHHHDNHVHFKCTKCEQITCLDQIKIPTITLPKGFAVNRGDLLLTGTCAGCGGK